MINFQLNQSKPSISLLTFGNADHKNGLTSFRIQCRIFLCWGKSGTGILGPASAVLLRPEVSDGPWIPCQQQMKNVSQQTDQREKIKKYKPWRKYPSSVRRRAGHGGPWARAIWTFSNLFSDISHSTIQSYHR